MLKKNEYTFLRFYRNFSFLSLREKFVAHAIFFIASMGLAEKNSQQCLIFLPVLSMQLLQKNDVGHNLWHPGVRQKKFTANT